MHFKEICDGRGRIARWVRALDGKSGVYVIRQKALLFPTVVYVGESHTGRLKKTLLRHFEKWTGKTAGPTYPRTKVEVAVIPCRADQAISRQNALIESLRPRDNIAAKPDLLNPF
jgi:excinuclease UvrABC nuclease subunit